MITFKRLKLVKEMIIQLVDYPYFKKCYEMMAIDLSKRQELVPDPKAIEQISFSGNLYQPENITMFFIIEEAVPVL